MNTSPTFLSSSMDARAFYSLHGVIFLTGATGFLGKAILEMLLRSVPTVSKIYILVRASRENLSVHSRVQSEIFENPLFDTLKSQFNSVEEYEHFLSRKVAPVEGDITHDNFGLSDSDFAMVAAETHVYIANAAAISFKISLEKSLRFNTTSTLNALATVAQFPNLISIVHVSSAYVNANLPDGRIEEKVYKIPFANDGPEQFYRQLGQMTSEEMSKFEKEEVLKEYPNSYSLAKSLTEHLIQARFSEMNLPIVIVRPTIITATLSEPVPGWFDGEAGSGRVIKAMAVGEVQEWIGKPNSKSDMIPVDLCAKLVLMAATVANKNLPQAPIFHLATSSDASKACTWGQLSRYSLAYWQAALPPLKRVSNAPLQFDYMEPEEFHRRFNIRFGPWVKYLASNKSTTTTMPALLSSDILNPQVKTRLERFLRFAKLLTLLYQSFMFNNWSFDTTQTGFLDRLAPVELKTRIGQEGIDWHHYLLNFNAGIQRFVLKEPVKLLRPLVFDFDEQFTQPPLEEAKLFDFGLHVNESVVKGQDAESVVMSRL